MSIITITILTTVIVIVIVIVQATFKASVSHTLGKICSYRSDHFFNTLSLNSYNNIEGSEKKQQLGAVKIMNLC